jgi:sensor domain CHASE-containing protein
VAAAAAAAVVVVVVVVVSERMRRYEANRARAEVIWDRTSLEGEERR